MLAIMEENATEVRKNWSDFVDTVAINQTPKVVSRNNKNPFLSISIDQVRTLLHAYRFNVTVEVEEDRTVTVELDNFDLFANADTLEDALSELAEDLIVYSLDYLNDIQLYYSSPNRTNHLPYVLAVLLQDDKESVINLLNANL